MKQLKYIAIAFSTIFLLAAVKLFLFPPPVSKDKSPSELHPLLIGTVNRAQQAYRVENGKFPNNLSDFEYIKDRNTYYSHLLEIDHNTAVIYAIPKQEYEQRKLWKIELGKNKGKPFYSYVGAVAFFPDSNRYQSIICQNKRLGIVKPSKPLIQEGSLFCDAETTEIRKD